ncbi:MAG TPA: RimK family alpha-L-glutamate ligase [Gemmatimonadales bacterium]|nr:RimK family alpha-L-glutamate ligase [Gemmatimonadales bacterium]
MAGSVVVLSARQGWHTDQLCRAVRSRGLEPLILPWESLASRMGHGRGVTSDRERLADAAAVLARIIPNGSLEQVIHRVDTLHRLEEDGIRVMNPARAIERSVDKAWASSLLERAGLPTPDTVVCERIDDAFAAFRAMGDVVVKPLFGSMGLGMVRVSDEDMAFRVFRAIEQVRGVFYLQRFVAPGGRDVRAFVVGDRVIGAIARSAPGWRTNVSRGGKAESISLSPELEALAIRAAQAVEAEYAGVDLLPASDGTVYLLEVNGIPGWRGLQEATGIDVAEAVIGRLLRPSTRR